MKRAPRSRQRHDLYAKYHDYDSEISDLLGECGFKARELAISAYESGDPAVRAEFDNITMTMTSILTTVGDAMRQVRHMETRTVLAEQAAGWVKPLVTLAGGLINGRSSNADDVDEIMSH